MRNKLCTVVYGLLLCSSLAIADDVSKTTIVTKVNAKDGAEMVLIPAGEFQMGMSEDEVAAWLRDNPDSNIKRTAFAPQMPKHKVNVDSFYMYRTEVTVAQYRKFCEATNRAMPKDPDDWKWKDAGLNVPISNVRWDDAKAYADWAGVMLPTEAQWERAARGGDDRQYSWGNTWPPPAKAGNLRDLSLRHVIPNLEGIVTEKYDDRYAYLAPVGSFNANPYGLYDMTGNVLEWCADWYSPNYYSKSPTRNPTGPSKPDDDRNCVIRGGSYYTVQFGIRVYDRDFVPKDGVGWSPAAHEDLGFRCVMPVPPKKL